MKELLTSKDIIVVFAFDGEPPVRASAISSFVDYDLDSIFSFYMKEGIDKLFLIDMKNFAGNAIDYDINTWNLENILEVYQELLDMGINDNVLIKVLKTRSRSWDYWTYCFDLTDSSEEDIAMVLMRWKGVIYVKEKN